MTQIDDGSAPESEDNPYKILLESTKAIPWRIDWETKQFDYIGPQIEKLLGWPRDSWKSAQDWIDRIHVEEREKTANLCITQSECGIDHEADYRALTADGGYVWVRDVVHVLRENGKTQALVGFMFDISERKKMEDVLVTLNQQLEALSFHDALTGIANRRQYDQVLDTEWRRALRNQSPISVIAMDVDFFKQFNDRYGHLAGDDCLKQIADTLRRISRRASDLLARYGGEEFVLLLPDTNREEATALAEHCRELVERLQIPHTGFSEKGVVTISAGVSTMIPTEQCNPTTLFGTADKMLYQAKQQGRNRVVAAGPRAALDHRA